MFSQFIVPNGTSHSLSSYFISYLIHWFISILTFTISCAMPNKCSAPGCRSNYAGEPYTPVSKLPTGRLNLFIIG